MTSLPIQALPLVMTTQEVAEVLRCSAATVERYIHAQELPAVKIGRERRIRAEDLLDFVASRPTTANASTAQRNRGRPR